MDNEIYRVSSLMLNYGERLATVYGVEAHFLTHDFEVLRLLVANTGTVVRIEDFLHRIWGPEYQSENNFLHMSISRIKKKLGSLDPGLRARIKNQYGTGYVFLNAVPNPSEDKDSSDY